MRRFDYRDEKSAKFWAIDLQGSSFRFTFGKIGKPGQMRLKEFADEATARSEHDRAIAEKLREGYVEVGATPAPRTSSKPPTLLARVRAVLDEPLDDALQERIGVLASESRFPSLVHVPAAVPVVASRQME
jgi:predicted DNA-binding WGR domain protein